MSQGMAVEQYNNNEMNEGRRDDEAAREDDDENANKIKKTPLY
tara:strand:+ start:359 stop:487 length:129 start_codon:yes stop_codon:yes gene_type:complete